VFKSRLTYVTRISSPKPDGGYAYATQRHPDLSLDEVRELELQLKRQTKTFDAGSEVMRLSGVFDLYMGMIQAKNPRWSVECKRVLGETLGHFGDIPAAKLTRPMVLAWRNVLMERPNQRRAGAICNRTVNAYMAIGRAAYNHVEPGGHNPYRQLGRLPERLVVEFLTEEEEERLLLVARTRMPLVWRFICISLATGFRRSEVLNLKRSEVDLIGKTITIRQKGNRVHTKPLLKMAENVLASIPDDGSDYYFFNPATGRPYQDLKNGFKKCLHLAGIDKPFRVHGLRHHVAFKLLKAQRNLKLVQDFLGHSQITTTTRYLAMLPEDIRDQTLCLEIPSVTAALVSDSSAGNVVQLHK
jgi:integrase